MTRQDIQSKAGLVIDTNLLLLYLIGSYDPKRIDSFKRTRGIYSVDDFYLLEHIIRQFGGFSTTPNILTEVSNFVDREHYDDVPMLTVLRDKVIYKQEHYIESKTVLSSQDETFVKFGVSDTVLYYLAQANYTILTVDVPLWSFLENKRLPTLNFNHLRSDSLLS